MCTSHTILSLLVVYILLYINMGVGASGYLEEPITDVETEVGQGTHVHYAVSSMQGWRSGMEDAHAANTKFTKNSSLFAVFDGHGGAEVAKLAGKELGPMIKKHEEFKAGNLAIALKKAFIEFDQHLLKEPAQKKLRDIQSKYEKERRALVKRHQKSGSDDSDDDDAMNDDDDEAGGSRVVTLGNTGINLADQELTPEMKQRLKEEVMAKLGLGADDMDQIFDEDDSEDDSEYNGGNESDDSEYNGKDSDFGDAIYGIDCGTTALVAILEGNSLTVANAGDCRAVLSRQGLATDLSTDHAPELESEKERIYQAGSVIEDGRVDGGLNLCRALGDHNYKRATHLPPERQPISPSPDVTQVVLQPDLDDFLVLACDGIWNSMTSQEVVDFIKERLPAKGVASPKKLASIGQALLEDIVAEDLEGDGSGTDNMTLIIIQFHGLPVAQTPSKRAGGASTPSRLLRPRKLVKQEL